MLDSYDLGLGIPVAPSFRTFRVNLGGYSAFGFLIPREEVLLLILFYLLVSSIFLRCSHKCPCIQDLEREYVAVGEPYPWGGCGRSGSGHSCDHAVTTEPDIPEE